jgi:phosphoribosylformylglycinamidine (FGAM) synthase PurS component
VTSERKRADDMRAILNLDLKAGTPEEAQRVIEDVCRKLQVADLINDYRFEIETPDGPVTERCVLADGKVSA